MEHDVTGVVYLVGAGPGDPGLLTRRGADLLSRADVVVYDGLASPVLLRLARADCERIYAGKKRPTTSGRSSRQIGTNDLPGRAVAADPLERAEPLTQTAIERVLIDRARSGKMVVRLKGGDPFVFGRGAEECEALLAAGVRFEVVPGVSAATAVPAYAGIPLTARGVASTVAYATGHGAEGAEPEVDWSAVARADTIVLFMAVGTAADCCARLVAAGRDATTPAAAIHWGTTASQRTVVATLGDLGDAIARARLRPPALLIIGDVVRLRERLSWYDELPLAGARVLVTRAADRAEGFAAAVEGLGGEPLVVPLTRVAPPPPSEAARLEGAIDRVGSFRWVVFTSANAVDCFFAALDRRGLDARALGAAHVACVGAATASALRGHGIRAEVVPAHGDAAAVARAVEQAADGSLAGVPILLPRVEGGREEAAELLARAGAAVETISVYQLEPVTARHPAVVHALERLRRGEVQCAAFFAPSQVRALCDLLGDDAGRVLQALPVVGAIGATTARALAAHGVTAHVVASSPEAELLATEMAKAFAARRV